MLYSVRHATEKDVPFITEIFNQGIEDGVATLETRVQKDEDIHNWLTNRDPRYVVIVVLNNINEICGYASLNKFNFKSAYTGVADISIYIKRSSRGQGVGKILLDGLYEAAKKEGFYKLVLNVISKNKAAIKFYEKMGYSYVGVYKNQGMLHGEWVDMMIMEKFLAEGLSDQECAG